MSSNGYRTNDDLLDDAVDVAERQTWEFDEPGDALGKGRDIEWYCSQVDYEKEEREIEARDAERRKTPEEKAVDAVKKKEEQDNYDYVYKGIVRESFVPTPRDIKRRERLLANREKTKNVPFPFE
jgi:hypothetical protein